jgi:hypothetical protein
MYTHVYTYEYTYSLVAMSYCAILTSSPSIEKFPATTSTRLALILSPAFDRCSSLAEHNDEISTSKTGRNML